MDDFDHGKLFVGGISRDTSEFALRDYFSQYGEVAFSSIAKDRFSGISRGFGFVTFTNPSSADKVLSEHHEISGRVVEVKKAIPRSEQLQFRHDHQESGTSCIGSNGDYQYRTRKIFVGGLSANLTEDEFRDYFEKFGRITDAVVMHDSVTNRPRGFGFITFDTEDVVEEILKNNYHELGGKYVEVKRAIPKDPSRITSYGRVRGIGGRNSPYGVYWPNNYWPDNIRYGLYSSHEYLSPYSYNGIYYPRFQMPGYGSAGFATPLAAPPANPWNGLQMGRYGPLPYGSGPVYHMNGVFGAVSVGASNGVGNTVVNRNLDSDGDRRNHDVRRQSSLPKRESVIHNNKTRRTSEEL